MVKERVMKLKVSIAPQRWGSCTVLPFHSLRDADDDKKGKEENGGRER